MGLACQRASGAVGAGASVTGRWAMLSGRHMRQGAGGWAGRVSEGKAGSGDARERLETAREMGRSVRRSGGRRAGEASGALGRLRDGCGDWSEFGPVARDEGERGRSGPRWVTGPRGGRGRSGPQERERAGLGSWVWAGLTLGVGLLSISLFLNLIQTKFEFKYEFEFKPQSNKSMHQHECNTNF